MKVMDGYDFSGSNSIRSQSLFKGGGGEQSQNWI